ncbi:MAG TPA: HmuY family protein [Gemmatimonadales bacterium]|nr:HmuY family protein [Gemmatimonadales bacterium]
MRSSVWLFGGFGVFLGLLGYLLASSLTRHESAAFAPREAVTPRAGGRGPDTLTIDARDPERWRFVDLERGRTLAPPDTAGWDIAIRRFHVIASGAIADAGAVAFDSLARPPESGYMTNTTGSDSINPGIRRWYSYGMLSHLLVPKGHLYVVRTSEGRFAKLELISYYCPGLEAGCLTFRYRFLE